MRLAECDSTMYPEPMERYKLAGAFVALFWTASQSPGADLHLPFGEHIAKRSTKLALTESQVKELDAGKRSILLSDAQRVTLRRKVPRGASVKSLEIYETSESTCTCGLANVAARTARDSIEVADALFGLDLAKSHASTLSKAPQRPRRSSASSAPDSERGGGPYHIYFVAKPSLSLTAMLGSNGAVVLIDPNGGPCGHKHYLDSIDKLILSDSKFGANCDWAPNCKWSLSHNDHYRRFITEALIPRLKARLAAHTPAPTK